MYYTVIRRLRQKDRTVGYTLKDEYGNIVTMTNDTIKKLIKTGCIVNGLKIGKRDRLLQDTIIGLPLNSNNCCNNISIETGDTLIKRCITETNKFTHRDMVDNIVDYSLNGPYNRIYVIHGIRRTGKTVSMQHSITELAKRGIPSNKIYLITITGEISFKELVDILKNIKESTVFIDEITNVKEVIASLNYLSDILAGSNKLRIIVSGTDSYVFPIAKSSSLYGRTYTSHSTLISYKEYTKVFGYTISDDSYNRYIEDGSIYSNEFVGNLNVINAINSTTIQNIINTIQRNRTFITSNTCYNNILKFKEEELSFLIYSILVSVVSPKSDNNITKVIKSLNKSKMLFLANACNKNINDIPKIMRSIKNNDLLNIIDILNKLDIIRRVQNLADYVISEEQESIGYKSVTDYEVCVTIPGLLYTIENTLNITQDSLVGNITENTVISNLYMLKPKDGNRIIDIGYLKYQVNGIEHEIDAVINIQDSNFETYYTLVEIKHSSNTFNKFAQHLITEDIPLGIKNKAKNRIIVYLGKTTIYNNIKYINILDFLTNTWKYIV